MNKLKWKWSGWQFMLFGLEENIFRLPKKKKVKELRWLHMVNICRQRVGQWEW